VNYDEFCFIVVYISVLFRNYVFFTLPWVIYILFSCIFLSLRAIKYSSKHKYNCKKKNNVFSILFQFVKFTFYNFVKQCNIFCSSLMKKDCIYIIMNNLHVETKLSLIHKIKHSMKSTSAIMTDIRRFCRIMIINDELYFFNIIYNKILYQKP